MAIDLQNDILPYLENVTGPDAKGNYKALCPYHEDTDPSFSVHPEKGFNCFACDTKGTLKTLADYLSIHGNRPVNSSRVPKARKQTTTQKEVVTYDYVDEHGKLLFQAVRYEDKTFKQRRPDPEMGGWAWGLGDTRRVLYHLDELTQRPDETVYVTEGEKDADRLRDAGLLATCSPMGANKWNVPEYTDTLKGRNVVILPDNDDPGKKHANDVATKVYDVVTSIKIVNGILVDLPEKGDVYDWLEIHTVNELLTLVQNTPTWTPESTPDWTDPWRIFTPKDAFTERPPLEFLVDGLLPLPSLSIVYGPPGALKTLLLQDMAVCVAGGLPWLQTPGIRSGSPKQTKQAPVLWVDLDNGIRRTHERFEAFLRAYELPEDTPLYYVSMPEPWLEACNTEHVEDLRRRIVRYGVKLCIIDNLGAIRGGIDENSADMARVMQPLRQLCETTNTGLAIIHHQNKMATVGRAGDRLRGNSCIEAALDLALYVERDEGIDLVTLKSTKTRDVQVKPFGAEWSYEHKTDSTELYTARFWGANVENNAGEDALLDAIFKVLEDAPPEGLKQQDVVDAVRKAVDVGINTIRHKLDTLVENNAVNVVYGPYNAKMYRPYVK